MKRFVQAVLATGVLAASLLLFMAVPAGAQSAGCAATFDGVNISSYSTPKTAKKVDENSRMTVTGSAFDLFYLPGESRDLAYLVKLELAGASWTVQSGVSKEQGWSGTIDIKKYATRGAGIYKVVAVTQSNSGTQCFGRAYVKVKSGGPLSTTAGQVAAGAGLAGAAGLAVAGARAGNEITEEKVGEAVTEFLEEQGGGPPPETPIEEEAARARAELMKQYDAELNLLSFCATALLLAAAATLVAVTKDAAHQVVALLGGWWR